MRQKKKKKKREIMGPVNGVYSTAPSELTSCFQGVACGQEKTRGNFY